MNKLILVLLALSSPLLAHNGVEHAQHAARKADAAVSGAHAKGAKAKAKASRAVEEAVAVVEPLEIMQAQASHHLHNKLVHFPLALGIFGALFLILSFRYPSYKWPARVMLFFAGVTAAFALPTGAAQSGDFESGSLSKVLEWHEIAGKTALGLIWLSFVLSFVELSRKFYWLIAVALILALTIAGGLGGVLATS